MGRQKVDDEEVLKFELKTRVNEKKYNELQAILKQTINMDMSGLLRKILNNKPIKTYVHDRTLDMVMEELSALRFQIKAIGVNINQITKYFNTFPEPQRKQFYAKIAFQQYTALQPLIERILEIVTQLSKKWLSV